MNAAGSVVRRAGFPLACWASRQGGLGFVSRLRNVLGCAPADEIARGVERAGGRESRGVERGGTERLLRCSENLTPRSRSQ